MATPQEKAQGVFWFIETKSDDQTQRKYRIKYGRDPPCLSSNYRWHEKFIQQDQCCIQLEVGHQKHLGNCAFVKVKVVE